MYDLNSLVQLDAPLYLLTACWISDTGAIAGFGVTDDGEIHGFLAVPNHGAGGGLTTFAEDSPSRKMAKPLSGDARTFLMRHMRFGGLGPGANQ